jgi:hypothetical protein
LTGDSTCRSWAKLEPLKYVRISYKQIHRIKPLSSHIHKTLKWSRTIEAELYRSNNVSIAPRSISHERNHRSILQWCYQTNTSLAGSRTHPGPQGIQASLVPRASDITSASPEDWTHWLAIAMAIHNNRKNETIGLSPNQILLGYELTLQPEEDTPSNNEAAEMRI